MIELEAALEAQLTAAESRKSTINALNEEIHRDQGLAEEFESVPKDKFMRDSLRLQDAIGWSPTGEPTWEEYASKELPHPPAKKDIQTDWKPKEDDITPLSKWPRLPSSSVWCDGTKRQDRYAAPWQLD